MRTEYTVEDGVHVTKLAMEIECVRQSFRIEVFCNSLIGGNALAKARVCFPSRHGVFLHGLIGIVARHAAFHEVLQQLRSEEHTSELQSRLHLVCRLLLEQKKTHN